MKIVLASSNAHKVKEINEIVKKLGYNIEFILPEGDFDPVEDGNTFEDNSLIKAKAAWELTHTWCLADDSGLCIKALDNRPGIFSARYAETPQKRIEKVLNEMKNINSREAFFACAMTLINPNGKVEFSYKGICEGKIAFEAKGEHGFGYDPIFVVKNTNKTMAELNDDEKNEISHRSIALKKVLSYISEAHLAENE